MSNIGLGPTIKRVVPSLDLGVTKDILQRHIHQHLLILPPTGNRDKTNHMYGRLKYCNCTAAWKLQRCVHKPLKFVTENTFCMEEYSEKMHHCRLKLIVT